MCVSSLFGSAGLRPLGVISIAERVNFYVQRLLPTLICSLVEALRPFA